MNYYEVTFTYDTSVETEAISDVLAAELGEIGFESFTENAERLQAYIPENKYAEATLQEKLMQFPIEGVGFHYTAQRVRGMGKALLQAHPDRKGMHHPRFIS